MIVRHETIQQRIKSDQLGREELVVEGFLSPNKDQHD